MDPSDSMLAAWRTNQRVTAFLVGAIPLGLWPERLPGIPRRTVRSLAAHLHNSRCMWIKTLGSEQGIAAPAGVDLRTVTRRQLLAALRRSGRGMEALLRLGLENAGVIAPTRAYAWRNLPLDVGHVLAYFVAHEAHHRGQIIMAARQLGQPLPADVIAGMWQFRARSRDPD